MTDPESASALDNPPELDAKTLGEHIEDAQASDQEQREAQDADSQDSEVAITADEPNALLPTLRELVAQYEELDKEWQRLKRQAKDTKGERDACFERIKELAGTKTPQEMHDLPVMQAARGEAPMIHPPVDETTDYAYLGTVAANCGAPESQWDTHGGTAQDKGKWIWAWRQATMQIQDIREAQVQALFEDALQKALMPHPGFLPVGEETPKVKGNTVEWDKRPHLVLDVLVAGDRKTWMLQPLYLPDEFQSVTSGQYGEPINGVDANDEAKANRIRGGIDCGKRVKVGRSVYVVGPRSSVVLVYTDSTNQPKF